jgi:hypothetical protein
LDDIIKQSILSQLESVKFDDDESKEASEKHQLESLAMATEETDDEKKAKFDAFEQKLKKIKEDNEAILKSADPNKNLKDTDSSDEN